MKKLLAILMSFQLICTPLALAEETPPPSTTTATPGPTESSTDALRDNPDKAADIAYYGQQLLTIATACIGTNILAQCKLGSLHPSLYFFMAGSVVQILGEMVGAKALNDSYQRSIDNLKVSEKKLEEAKDSGGNQAVIIDAAIAEQESVKKFLRDRATWTWVLSGFYWAAMIAAIFEQVLEVTPFVWKPSFAGCTSEPLGLWTSVGLVAVYTAMISGLPQAMFGGGAQAQTNHGVTIATSLIGTGLAVLIPTLSSGVALAYQTAVPRIITFGAFGALVTALGISYEMKVTAVEENLTKLNKVKKDMEETKDDDPDGGVKGSADSGGPSPNADSTDFKSKGSSASVKSSKTCGSISDKGFSAGSDCSKALKLNAPDFGDNFDIPELQSFANQGTELANSAARGDTEAANAQASSLASKAGRMRAIAEKLKKKLNEELKKAGRDEIDFDKEINNKLLSLNQDLNQSLGKGSSLASMDGKAFLDAVKSADGSSSNGPTGALAAATKPAQAAAKGFSLKGFDAGNEEIKPQAQANSPTLSDSLGQFESNVSDISNKKEVSIFALLSNRYVLSYEKILKRKEPNEVPKVESKTGTKVLKDKE